MESGEQRTRAMKCDVTLESIFDQCREGIYDGFARLVMFIHSSGALICKLWELRFLFYFRRRSRLSTCLIVHAMPKVISMK